MPLLGERPHRRPVELGVGVEARRHDVVGMPLRVDALPPVELGVAEQLHVVRVDRLPVPDEVGEARPAADLVPVAGAAVAFDRLAERARLGLLARGPLAGALAPEAPPERAQAPAPHAEVASGPVDVEPGVRLVGRALEPRHDAAHRTHEVAVPGERGLGRHGARASAVQVRLGARARDGAGREDGPAGRAPPRRRPGTAAGGSPGGRRWRACPCRPRSPARGAGPPRPARAT